MGRLATKIRTPTLIPFMNYGEYQSFYMQYIKPSIETFLGLNGNEDIENGYNMRKVLQTVAETIKSHIVPFTTELKGVSKNDTLSILNELRRAVWYAQICGTSVLTVNRDDSGKYWLDSKRFDMVKSFEFNRDQITRIEIFTDVFSGYGTNKKDYRLFEVRELKGNKPFVHYEIQTKNTSINGQTLDLSGARVMNPPKQILDWCASMGIKLNKDIPLPADFGSSIGVEFIKLTEDLPAYPNMPCGRSLADMCEVENIMYNYIGQLSLVEGETTKNEVLIPDEMIDIEKPMHEQLNQIKYKKALPVDGVNQSKPELINFPIRAADIKAFRDFAISEIAFKTRFSEMTLLGSLQAQGSYNNTTQIQSQLSQTEVATQDYRAIIHLPILRLLRIIYGEAVDIIWKNTRQGLNDNERIQTMSTELELDHITPEFYVNDLYDDLPSDEQQKIIDHIRQIKALQYSMKIEEFERVNRSAVQNESTPEVKEEIKGVL